jgi:hypothetical protein
MGNNNSTDNTKYIECHYRRYGWYKFAHLNIFLYIIYLVFTRIGNYRTLALKKADKRIIKLKVKFVENVLRCS